MDLHEEVAVIAETPLPLSPDLVEEIARENGDGDEEGWPTPVIAVRTSNPDGQADVPEDPPIAKLPDCVDPIVTSFVRRIPTGEKLFVSPEVGSKVST